MKGQLASAQKKEVDAEYESNRGKVRLQQQQSSQPLYEVPVSRMLEEISAPEA